jgi:hypothetical protein
MKVSAIQAISADECRPRRNLFIRFSNSYMSTPEVENPIEKANEVLKEVFPEFDVQITTPDEKMRRVGQSIAAASLPATK